MLNDPYGKVIRMESGARRIPDAFDALSAAPEHHKLMMENDEVRVLEALIPPGERTNVHSHCWPGVQYVISFSHFIRRDATGNVTLDSRTQPPIADGTTLWSAPLGPHSAENVGERELRVLIVELKKSQHS